MDNGYIILSIVALLFLSIYGFSYASVTLGKYRAKKAMNNEMLLEEIRLQDNVKKQEIRDEKLRKQNKRREEISHELRLLEQMKENRDKSNKMRVEQMKKKKVS
jgi:hypothetical protein